jgi:CheY-like chemotaxis protein
MKCPKCDSSFTGAPDSEGLFHCPECGARLRGKPPASGGSGSEAPARALEALLDEVRAVRLLQEEILGLLRSKGAPATVEARGEDESEDEPSMAPPAIRARRAKTVLILDDQDETRAAALAALERAQVPTRAASDGPRGLEAIAAERPDVIVLELAMGGALAGKDVINMIKSTMEWIDIPIILWTRLPIESQKEARTVHGADEVVQKGPGGADALVARVIQLFRRG